MATPSADVRIAALVPDVEASYRAELAAAVRTLREVGNQLGVVVGMSRLASRLAQMVYEQAGKRLPKGSLFDWIEAGVQDGLIPGEIASCLHTVRTFSNKVDHDVERTSITAEDAENVLRLFLRALAWVYCEYEHGPRLPTIYALEHVAERAPQGDDKAALPAPQALRHTRRGRLMVGLLAIASLAAALAGWTLLRGAPSVPDWPNGVRLLVVPFRFADPRPADEVLWPLADRMVVNALEGDDRILQRLDRVDPLVVEEELQRRELGNPPQGGEIDELVGVLEATVVLEGSLARDRGRVRFEGSLRTAGRQRILPLAVDGDHAVGVARLVADRLREELWDDEPTEVPAERLDELLLASSETARSLRELTPSTPSAARREAYERLITTDPRSVGLVWLRLLSDVRSSRWSKELGRRASDLEDDDLRAFFEELAGTTDIDRDCDGPRLGALGERHPLVLGPLALALCHQRRGDISKAMDRALDAFRRQELRPLAAAVVRQALHYTHAPEKEVEVRARLQSLMPEHVLGWSRLAITLGEVGRMEEAKGMLRVAASMPGEDQRTRYLVGYHGALVHLLAFEPGGAGDWIDLMKRHYDAKRPDGHHWLLVSAYAQLQGRSEEALESLRDGLRSLRSTLGDDYTILATTAFYRLVAAGRYDKAAAVLTEFETAFPEPRKRGDSYGITMLRLVLATKRAEVTEANARERMRSLGEDLVQETKERGAYERAIHESLAWTHLDWRDDCRDLLFRAPTNRFIGGCRFRYALLLAAGGDHAEAARQLDTALVEITRARFGALSYVPAIMLALAIAQERLGRAGEALRWYERIVASHARADHEVPEVIQAARAIARLAEADGSAGGRGAALR